MSSSSSRQKPSVPHPDAGQSDAHVAARLSQEEGQVEDFALESQSRSQSLRDGIQATLQMSGVSAQALSTSRQHQPSAGALLGASSTSLAQLAPSTRVSFATSPMSTTPALATTTATTMTTRLHAVPSLAMLEKSVDDLIFASTPPPLAAPPPLRQHAGSTTSDSTRSTAPASTAPSRRPHQPQAPVQTVSSSDVLLQSSRESGVSRAAQPISAHAQKPPPKQTVLPAATVTATGPRTRPPIVGAQPPLSPFASPASAHLSQQQQQQRGAHRTTGAAPAVSSRWTDDTTTTMDHAVHVPAALRGAGRRTMLDVVLQRERHAAASAAPDEAAPKKTNQNQKQVEADQDQRGEGKTSRTARRHASAVQALLFPRGIAIDTATPSPVAPSPAAAQVTAKHTEAVQALATSADHRHAHSAAVDEETEGVENREASPDLRRSLRHLLPSARAKAAALVKGDAEAQRAQRLHTQAQLANDISDFSSSHSDEGEVAVVAMEEEEEGRGHAQPPKATSHISSFATSSQASHAVRRPPSNTGAARSAVSAFLAQFGESDAPTPAPDPRHAANAIAPLTTASRHHPRATISGLLRGDDSQEAPGMARETGSGGGGGGGGGIPVDALLDVASPTPGAIHKHVKQEPAAGAQRGSVLALLTTEEAKRDATVRAHHHRRHPEGDADMTDTLAGLADEELFAGSRPSSRASSSSSRGARGRHRGGGDRSRSSSPDSTTTTSRGSETGKVYLDALVDERVSDENLLDTTTAGSAVDSHGRRISGVVPGQKPVSAVEASWRSVCQALSALLTTVAAQEEASALEGETERDARPSLDVRAWWGRLLPPECTATCAYLLRVTNLGCAFGKPPALTIASLATANSAGAMASSGLTGRRRGLGGLSGGDAHPAFVMHGPPRLPPFTGPFLATTTNSSSIGTGRHALQGTRTVARPQMAYARRGAVNEEDGDGEDDAGEAVVASEPATRHAEESPAAHSMVYRLFELFQAALLDRIGRYVYSSPNATKPLRDDNEDVRDGSVLVDEMEQPNPHTPFPTRAEQKQINDVMSWGEQVAQALEVNKTRAQKQRHHNNNNSNEKGNIFSVALQPDQLPSRRLVRRLVDNPTAARVVAYLQGTFNQHTYMPRLAAHPSVPDLEAEQENAQEEEEDGVDVSRAHVDGLDVHFRVRSVDSAFGLVRVKGDLCFVSADVRDLFWPPDAAARSYSDGQVRALLRQSLGRGWVLLLPASVAEAVPVSLDACVYLSRPFVVVPSQRLLMSSYVVTSDALLTWSTRALTHLVARALDVGAPRLPKRREQVRDDDDDDGAEESVLQTPVRGQKRSRHHHYRAARAGPDGGSSSSSSSSPSVSSRGASPGQSGSRGAQQKAALAASAAAVVVVGTRSQTSTPQRPTRVSYMLSALATAAAVPAVRGAGHDALEEEEAPQPPRKRPHAEVVMVSSQDSRMSPSHDRGPSITPFRQGFYDPFALTGLGGGGGGEGGESARHDTEAGEDGHRRGVDQALRFDDPLSHNVTQASGTHHADGAAAQSSSSLSAPSATTAPQQRQETQPSTTQAELKRAWAARDPVGASFPRGPDPRWHVPLEVLLALVAFSPVDTGVVTDARVATQTREAYTVMPILGDDEDVEEEQDAEGPLEDVSVDSDVRAYGLGGGGRDATSLTSITLTPSRAGQAESLSQWPGSTASAPTVSTAQPCVPSRTTAGSISSIFPDVFLDSQR